MTLINKPLKSIIICNAVKTGDEECGYLEVSEESYREAVGEKRYKEELDWKIRNIEWAQTEVDDAKNNVPCEGLLGFAGQELERAKKRRNHWALYLDHLIWALDLEDDDVFDIEIKLLKKEKNHAVAARNADLD